MIRRAPRPTHSFVIVRNEVARDERISYRARGLLIAILSRPDNWTIRAEQLASESSVEGRDAVRTALKELQAAGYLVSNKVRNSDGQIQWESVVYDSPQSAESPETENPSPVKPASVELATVSQAPLEELSTRTEKKKKTPTGDTVDDRDSVREVFAEWIKVTGRSLERTILDDKRRRRIEWALKTYSRTEITQALQGWKRSKWHRGENTAGKVYDELTLIFKDSANFERFRNMYVPPVASTAPQQFYEAMRYCGDCEDGYVRATDPQGQTVLKFCPVCYPERRV